MNRFLRAVYSATYVYVILILFAVIATGVEVPLLSFLCLLLGILIAMLPAVFDRLVKKRTLFTVLGVLIAASGFVPVILHGCPVMHYVICGLGIAEGFAFCLIRREMTIHLWFLRAFRTSLILLLSAIAVVFLAIIPMLYDGHVLSFGWERVRTALDNTVPVIVLLLSIGILFLRRLRSEQGGIDSATINRRQIRDLTIFGALVGVIFTAHLFVNLRSTFNFLYDRVIYPLFEWLVRLFSGKLKMDFIPEDSFPQPADDFGLPDPSIFQQAPDPSPSGDQSVLTGPDLALPDKDLVYRITFGIFIAVSVIVFIGLVIIVVRRFLEKYRERKDVHGYPDETEVQITEEEPQRDEETPRKHSNDPRERMRYQYGEFLRFLRKASVPVETTNTCGEIRKNAYAGLRTGPEDLSDFTALYEKARYRQQESVTDDDDARMKTLFGRIRSNR